MAGKVLSDEEAEQLSTWPPEVARSDLVADLGYSQDKAETHIARLRSVGGAERANLERMLSRRGQRLRAAGGLLARGKW